MSEAARIIINNILSSPAVLENIDQALNQNSLSENQRSSANEVQRIFNSIANVTFCQPAFDFSRNFCGSARSGSINMSRVTIRFMILRPLTTRGHPLTTWTLALHSRLHSTSDYNSHHPLHWRHTADCTEHTADYPDTHSWLHWSHSLLKPWTSSLSLPSFVERLASPRC